MMRLFSYTFVLVACSGMLALAYIGIAAPVGVSAQMLDTEEVLRETGEATGATCDVTKAYAFLQERATGHGWKITPRRVSGDGQLADGLNPEFACRLERLFRAAGCGKIFSAVRDRDDTIRACGTANGAPGCNAFGRSCHNYGLAVDVSGGTSCVARLRRLAPQFKLHFPYENPHIQCVEHRKPVCVPPVGPCGGSSVVSPSVDGIAGGTPGGDTPSWADDFSGLGGSGFPDIPSLGPLDSQQPFPSGDFPPLISFGDGQDPFFNDVTGEYTGEDVFMEFNDTESPFFEGLFDDTDTGGGPLQDAPRVPEDPTAPAEPASPTGDTPRAQGGEEREQLLTRDDLCNLGLFGSLFFGSCGQEPAQQERPPATGEPAADAGGAPGNPALREPTMQFRPSDLPLQPRGDTVRFGSAIDVFYDIHTPDDRVSAGGFDTRNRPPHGALPDAAPAESRPQHSPDIEAALTNAADFTRTSIGVGAYIGFVHGVSPFIFSGAPRVLDRFGVYNPFSF